jgi:hypothetical protein
MTKLTWTTEKPTEAGWHWARRGDGLGVASVIEFVLEEP